MEGRGGVIWPSKFWIENLSLQAEPREGPQWRRKKWQMAFSPWIPDHSVREETWLKTIEIGGNVWPHRSLWSKGVVNAVGCSAVSAEGCRFHSHTNVSKRWELVGYHFGNGSTAVSTQSSSGLALCQSSQCQGETQPWETLIVREQSSSWQEAPWVSWAE